MDWPTVVNTLIATLPAIIVAITALIVALRSKAKIDKVEEKLNGKT